MRVRWTAPAARDLTHICDYIEEHDSSATARRVALSIYERLSALVEFPERGRPGRKSGTRELILAGLPYLAVYRLRGDAVEILRILHGAQDWSK
jgi:plasmid stabilization system protein ParE